MYNAGVCFIFFSKFVKMHIKVFRVFFFFSLLQVEKPDSTNQADVRNLTAHAGEKGKFNTFYSVS